METTQSITSDGVLCTISRYNEGGDHEEYVDPETGSTEVLYGKEELMTEPIKIVEIYLNGEIKETQYAFSAHALSPEQLKKLKLYLQSFANQTLFGFNRDLIRNGYVSKFKFKHYFKKPKGKLSTLNAGICSKVVWLWLMKESMATNIDYVDILNIIHSYYFDILNDKQLQHEFTAFLEFLSSNKMITSSYIP
eukprot:25675_1